MCRDEEVEGLSEKARVVRRRGVSEASGAVTGQRSAGHLQTSGNSSVPSLEASFDLG